MRHWVKIWVDLKKKIFAYFVTFRKPDVERTHTVCKIRNKI